MQKFSDKIIISSWIKNVKPWITAIREEEIESRQLVTNKAIIDAVTEISPLTVLDVGCGEGWLVRELTRSGIKCLGIDAVPEFIKYAQNEGDGKYKLVSYEELSFDNVKEKFDILVCNFSLLGHKSVIHLFHEAPSLLNENGSILIQAIHPISACGERQYEDGWREGSWAAFSNEFSDPAPWYFRTLESWKALFMENGFLLKKTLVPLNPKTQNPASIIFVGEVTS